MSMDAEGVLFWGLWYSDDEVRDSGAVVEHHPEEDGPLDALEEKAQAMRQRERATACPEPPTAASGGRQYAGPEWDDWREKVAAWEDAACRVRRAGHWESQTVYVYVEASRLRAEWDEVKPVVTDVGADWERKLRDYVAALGLPWKAPGWFLTSHYG